MIGALSNARRQIRVTPSVTASRGKKTDDGTMMPPFKQDLTFKRAAVADPPETRNSTPATTKEG
jgi:hypothetical protein